MAVVGIRRKTDQRTNGITKDPPPAAKGGVTLVSAVFWFRFRWGGCIP